MGLFHIYEITVYNSLLLTIKETNLVVTWGAILIGIVNLGKSFVFNLSSTLLSELGDAIFTIVLSWYIVDTYHSGVLMGTFMLVVGIGRFISGIVGGSFIDVYGPRRIMLLSDIFRAIVLILIAAYEFFYGLHFATIITIGIVFGTVDALYWPASTALQQKIVSSGNYSRANGLYFTAARLIHTIGPAIGGFLLSISTFWVSFVVASLFFLLSALSISLIRTQEAKESKQRDKVQWTKSLSTGVSFILNNKQIRFLIIAMFFGNIGANGVMSTIPFLADSIHSGSSGLGIIRTCMGLGALTMGIILSIRSLRKASLFICMLGFFGQGLFIATVYWLHNLPLISISLFVSNTFTAVLGVSIPTIFQKVVPNHIMGQVDSVFTIIAMTSSPISNFVFASLVGVFSPSVIFLLGGGIEALTAIFALLILWMNSARRIDANLGGMYK